MTPALEISGLSKRFGGAVALGDVSLSVARGEVHGLLGSNGSGKSTLIKVLAGFHEPEPGAQVSLYDTPASLPMSGPAARDLGLAFAHQNLGLIPSLTVAENLRLGRLANANDWFIDWRAEARAARAVFARYDLSLDPAASVAQLSAVEQALLAIVRAVEDLRAAHPPGSDRPGVLILDEPTPFLPRSGVAQLFRLIRQLSDEGASVVFVSHDIDEVREITDRATILRDGHLIDTVETARTSHTAFVERIIGRSLDHYGGAHKVPTRGETQTEVRSLTAPGLGPIDLSVGAGEIVGLTGLIGAGAERVPALLYGAEVAASGEIRLGHRTRPLPEMTPEIALSHGVAYLPADRLGAAGIGALPVGDNVAMPVYERLRGTFGLTDRAILAHAARLGADADVRPNRPALPLSALSGGNAQKALMAKWLQVADRLLLLDEPTQGVDVGARQAIWDALDRAAERGTGILLSSTDYEQLAQLCHRVLIFADGRIVADLTGAALRKETIAERCFGAAGQAA